MEIVLDSEGRIIPKFCEDACRAIHRIMRDHNLSRKEAECVFIKAFEELASVAGRYNRLPRSETREALRLMRRGRRLEIFCGLEGQLSGRLDAPSNDLVKALGLIDVRKSQMRRSCGQIDDRVETFLDRPIEGGRPYLWGNATYVKVHPDGHIVSVAASVAVGINTDGWGIILASVVLKPLR